MTNFVHGRIAEAAAVAYLVSLKYVILQQNYRTRYCEIDIVAKYNQVIHFVEVKYRQSDQQGGGLDYLTPVKLKQMTFAAEMWLADNDWNGDYTLAAIEISGAGYQVTNFLDDLS